MTKGTIKRLRSSFAKTIYDASAEQLINAGRLATASFALIAVWLDPTRPTKDVPSTYLILIAYVIFSALVLTVWPNRSREDPLHALPTAIDILALGMLARITEELESPFFVFFTFTLITATIRWGWRGVLLTAVALQVVLLVVGIPDLEDGGDPSLNVLIMRSVFCWVAAAMLGYFGSYRTRSEYRLKELASWPHDIIPEEGRPWLSGSLHHAANVLGTDRIVVIWRDQDKAASQLACWTGNACRFADDVELPVGCTPFADGIRSGRLDETRSREVLDLLVPSMPADFADVRQRFIGQRCSVVHVAPFRSIRYSGSVLVIDPAFQDENVESLTRIVASRIALELEQFSLIGELASAAGLKERVRFARDLHDSVLQDLMAAVLQLEGAARKLPDDAQVTLGTIRNLLQEQQRRLRRFVTDTRSNRPDNLCLIDQLEAFVEPLGDQWNCEMRIDVDPRDLVVADAIATELCLALSEATANAVRHAGAKQIGIVIRSHAGMLCIRMNNDGDTAETSIARPASLTSRIEELGGELTTVKDASGFALSITIPMRRQDR